MPYTDMKDNTEAGRRYREAHKEKVWAAGTLYDHKKKGIVVDITTKELEAIALHVKHCEYCGIEIVYRNSGGQCEQSATLDRVDNERVIRADNIKIVCNSCNSSKRTRSFREFVLYCKMIADKFYTEV